MENGNKEEPSAGGAHRPLNILVVGDWVVDEHWVMGVQRSPTASRTGNEHLHALHGLKSTVRSLCGAGQTASILHRARLDNGPFCAVHGVGIWHPGDEEALFAMLEPEANTGLTPHRINDAPTPEAPALPNTGGVSPESESTEPPPPPSAARSVAPCRCNLAEKSAMTGSIQPPLWGTTRVIRIYRRSAKSGDKMELTQRLDWDLPIDISTELPPGRNERTPAICDDMSERIRKANIDAIVIKDMSKGVICMPIIEWLVDLFPSDEVSVPWFISTKAWKPDWLNKLNGQNVRLLLIPQVSAQQAVRDESNALNVWTTRGGRASREAIDEMDDLRCRLGRGHKDNMVVVLPDGFQLLARCERDRDNVDMVVHRHADTHEFAVGIPMASVLFAALTALLLRKGDSTSESAHKSNCPAIIIENALVFTQDWMRHEVDRIENHENWSTSDEPRLRLDEELGDKKTSILPDPVDWTKEREAWAQAFDDCGVVTLAAAKAGRDGETAPTKALELWRAMTDVDEYICSVPSKRAAVHRIVRELEAFRHMPAIAHASCMLKAPPGTGKTRLVRALAKAFELRFLPFNITQMVERADLLDSFDTIVSTQAQWQDERVLVFVDEINAQLDGQHVFDAFLAPIEEGTYVRGGKTFHIRPCAWIFAGTRFPHEDDKVKGSDFESRLSIEPCEFSVNGDEHDTAQLEKVYAGASLLLAEFPDVRTVSELVLKTFRNLRPEIGLRQIHHFVRSFLHIQHGRVHKGNIPRDMLRDLLAVRYDTWNAWPDGDDVEIHRHPREGVKKQRSSWRGRSRRAAVTAPASWDIPVGIVIRSSKTDLSAIEKIEEAVRKVLDSGGAVKIIDGPTVSGSVMKRIIARFASLEKVGSFFKDLYEVLRIVSDSTGNTPDCTEQLLQSVTGLVNTLKAADVDEAVIALGSVVLVKSVTSEGTGVSVSLLSKERAEYISENPEICESPEQFYLALETLQLRELSALPCKRSHEKDASEDETTKRKPDGSHGGADPEDNSSGG